MQYENPGHSGIANVRVDLDLQTSSKHFGINWHNLAMMKFAKQLGTG